MNLKKAIRRFLLRLLDLKLGILSDKDILAEMEKGTIRIAPFDRLCLGPNSYDVHLSKNFGVYKDTGVYDNQGRFILDARKHNEIEHFEIPEEGYVIFPGKLYLGTTFEYTETHAHIPFLEGKSSSGRLGISIHETAGKGDIGFCNYWTFEISCIHPVRIYSNMPIAQLIYHIASSSPLLSYTEKVNAKYIEKDPRPKESLMYKNKF